MNPLTPQQAADIAETIYQHIVDFGSYANDSFKHTYYSHDGETCADITVWIESDHSGASGMNPESWSQKVSRIEVQKLWHDEYCVDAEGVAAVERELERLCG